MAAAKKGFFNKVAENSGFTRHHGESPKKTTEHVAGNEFELSLEEEEKIKEEEEKLDNIPRRYGKLIHAVKMETRKEPRLVEELDKVIERPKRKKENIIFDFEELALDKPKILKKTLETLLGKKGEDGERRNEEIQAVINSMATELPGDEETTPAKKEKPKKAEPSYELPDNSDRKAYIRGIISAIRRDPELRAAIKEANLEPYSIDQYFDAINDPDENTPYNRDDDEIRRIVYSDFCAGDIDKAINAGLIIVRRFIADERGKSTGIPYPIKDSPKGKS